MTAYPQLLNRMMQAVLTNDADMVHGLFRGRKDFPAEKQFAVYADAYRLRLTEVVRSTYPALEFYLGNQQFSRIAQTFIEANPSRYFNLDTYPLGFAGYFLRHTEDNFAQQLAIFEHALHAVYQKEESAPLATGWLEIQTLESLAESTLGLRTASALLAFDYPLDAYVSAFREGRNPQKPAPEKQFVLVVRHRHQLQRFSLEAAEYSVLKALEAGKNIKTALAREAIAAYAQSPDFPARLMGWVTRWVEQGFLRQPS